VNYVSGIFVLGSKFCMINEMAKSVACHVFNLVIGNAALCEPMAGFCFFGVHLAGEADKERSYKSPGSAQQTKHQVHQSADAYKHAGVRKNKGDYASGQN